MTGARECNCRARSKSTGSADTDIEQYYTNDWQHGSAKLLHVPYQAMFAHLHLMSLMGVQGVIELVGGGLLAMGLFSRPVAFILSGDMAVAFFMAHFPKTWLPILNCSMRCRGGCRRGAIRDPKPPLQRRFASRSIFT